MTSDSTPLQTAAVAMHEAYTEFVRAGFTPAEALQIVIGMARGNSSDD